jgi:hypothetical protein
MAAASWYTTRQKSKQTAPSGELLNFIRMLRLNGFTPYDIAAETGIRYQTISKYTYNWSQWFLENLKGK